MIIMILSFCYHDGVALLISHLVSISDLRCYYCHCYYHGQYLYYRYEYY